ncbi:MAG: PIG-L family deacetylase, partial [Planctomycetales bacterium]|nr:PIG-L family deacetylase [Planctomycetales bacterium]
GAHPDDAEYHSGGLAAIYAAAGHCVKMISVTDGGAGHHTLSREELVPLRRREAAAAGSVIGAPYETWDFPDGRLQSTLEVRDAIIREIRAFAPDIVVTHRSCDYHPDHRAVGQAVQDASYLVTVPLICSDQAALRRDPVVLLMPDRFTRPQPLRGDVAIDVADQLDQIVRMLAAHESQFFEWLAYNHGYENQLPADAAGRLAFLRNWYCDHLRPMAAAHRAALVEAYGPARGEAVEFAEVYEVSEYAAPLDAAARRRLFWFLPTSQAAEEPRPS